MGFFWGEWVINFFAINQNNHVRTISCIWKPGLVLLYVTFPKIRVTTVHFWQHAYGLQWPLLQTLCISEYFNSTLFPLGSLPHLLSVHVTCCTEKAWGESSTHEGKGPGLKLGSISNFSQFCRCSSILDPKYECQFLSSPSARDFLFWQTDWYLSIAILFQRFKITGISSASKNLLTILSVKSILHKFRHFWYEKMRKGAFWIACFKPIKSDAFTNRYENVWDLPFLSPPQNLLSSLFIFEKDINARNI